MPKGCQVETDVSNFCHKKDNDTYRLVKSCTRLLKNSTIFKTTNLLTEKVERHNEINYRGASFKSKVR